VENLKNIIKLTLGYTNMQYIGCLDFM